MTVWLDVYSGIPEVSGRYLPDPDIPGATYYDRIPTMVLIGFTYIDITFNDFIKEN